MHLIRAQAADRCNEVVQVIVVHAIVSDSEGPRPAVLAVPARGGVVGFGAVCLGVYGEDGRGVCVGHRRRVAGFVL